MKHTYNKLAGCAIGMLALTGTAFADLLDVQPGFPLIGFGGGTSSATIDQTATPSYDLSASTLELIFTLGGNINLAAGTDAITTIQLNVDGLCDAIGGVAGDDLYVSGTVYDPNFNIIKSGVLLTGEITEAGNAMATETTAAFDFRATVTGGALVTDGDWPDDGFGNLVNAGIKVTLENTSIPFVTNNCASALTSGRAKGIIGPDESDTGPSEFTNPGTGTIGYWKTHPEAWPVSEITIAGVTYTVSEAIDLMDRGVKGDKSLSMFRQLVAAKLNVLIDNDNTCIQDEIDAADQWLVDNPVDSGVKANSDAWGGSGSGDLIHDQLDAYNNGQLCAPHRD